MVLNNTICYVGKACKYGLVHAAYESKMVVQGLDGYIVAGEDWTTACLLFERGTENQRIWKVIYVKSNNR